MMSELAASIATELTPGGRPLLSVVHVAPKSIDLRTQPPDEPMYIVPFGWDSMLAQIPGSVGPTLYQPRGLGCAVACPVVQAATAHDNSSAQRFFIGVDLIPSS